jgi:type IV pilus assembly protein PilC
MQTFTVKAKDSHTGQTVHTEVQAMTVSAASKIVVGQGLSPIDIKAKGSGFGGFGGRVTTKDKVVFSRQMATLLNAGLPLAKGLSTVGRQIKGKGMKSIINDVQASIESGNSFAVSLQKHEAVFGGVFISMISAGEASGTLDKTLDRIATQVEADAETMSKVKGAFVYPIIVIVVLMGVIAFMMNTILPQVQALYKDLKKPLPGSTKTLIGLVNISTKYWYLIILFGVTAGFVVKRYLATSTGRSVVDTVKMRAPPFNKLFMKLYMARLCRTGSALISTGVPLLETLRIVGDSIGNSILKKSLEKATEGVKGGAALSGMLEKDKNFLDLVPQMVQIGEESGAMDQMLERAAIYYEKELDNEIKALSTTIEPILMVVMAVLVGGLVSAILLPVYSLVGNANLR